MKRLCQLLLLIGIGQAVFAAPFFEFPDLTRRIPERSSTPGCAYRGDRYDHGGQVPTLEPCLNCTCIRAVVVCYLRVCPAAPSPPPGCFLAREAGQCCPTLICGGSVGLEKKPEPDETTQAPDLRPTFQPEPPPTTTEAPEENSLVFVSSTESYEDTEFLNDIPGGCLVNGTLYGDGSAMISSSFCEYCFCIRGKTTCLKPKCDLFIEGCKPLYDSNFSCCPSRYECYKKTTILETTITTESFPMTSTTTTYETTLSDNFADCTEDDVVYKHGEEVEKYRTCHSCYCNNASISCEEIKCSPPIPGCQPIIPEGHCCPVSYKCDQLEDTINYNVKGAKFNSSTLPIETQKGHIKGVKSSDIFNDIHDPNVDEGEEDQPLRKDLTSFFDNFVPLHRRFDEDIAELYLSPNENMDYVVPEHFTNLTNATSDIHDDFSRENDKTLNLDSPQQTTPVALQITAELSTRFTPTTKSPETERTTTPSVVVGSPEEKVIGIRDILDEYFANKSNDSSIFVTKEETDSKRNNSKHASVIGDDTVPITTPIFYSVQSTTSHLDDITNTDTSNIHETTPAQPQKSTEFVFTVTSSNKPEKSDDMNSLFIHTTLNFEEEEDITIPKDLSTSYIIRGTKHNRTYSTQSQAVTEASANKTPVNYDDIDAFVRKSTTQNEDILKETPIETKVSNNDTYLPNYKTHNKVVAQQYSTSDLTSTSAPVIGKNNMVSSSTDVKVTHPDTTFSMPPITVSSTKTTLRDSNFSSTTSTTKDLPEITTKTSSRINSKLPSATQKGEFKDTGMNINDYLDDAFLDSYLPALVREDDFIDDDVEDDDEDFTNVGSIHLGAPLSVEATETRRDPANLRNKITESGGVIFLDSKYTDIHPDLPIRPNNPKPNERNPIEDASSGGFTGYSIPIRRADVDMDYIKPDPKKGPRIQDVYNQTNAGQNFKVIPFVAEDAIRGLNGKVNGTYHLIPLETTEGPPDIVSDFCFIRGRIFKNGEMVVKQDPCELCRCFYGQELCQLQRCPTPPPDCTPEKLPNFCCPRYTCEKPPSGQVQFLNQVSPILPPISVPTQATQEPTSNPNFLPPTTKKPDTVKTSENPSMEVTRTTSSHFAGITRSSTARVTTTKQPVTKATTTKQPDTTKSSHFLDPWGLLQVSGCNIYGKFFNINDQVEILSGPCNHCICTVNGVECNDIC
ncbi:hypothetical protein JTE90_022484 [Oedothorax gibbosus]|uniref:VWFC domain-containing protein n=1 Tax=Oedothorax gibbosus TaxID=931172 RepID=A0AAV6V1J9_9ARAC|nr:hypothetical protein JTE90_022484 [Oedothorax gibbosus]